MSRWSLEDTLLALVAALSAAAAGIVFTTDANDPAEQAAGREFQSLTGGLGLGCQTDLTHGARGFDARLAEVAADGLPIELAELDPWQTFTLLAAPVAVTRETSHDGK